MSSGWMQRLMIVARAAAAHGPAMGGGRAPHLLFLLLLPVLAGLLFAGPAAGSLAGSSWIGHGLSVEPAELRSADLPFEAGRDPLESRPALKRGSVSMAAVESSRRKVRVPQRPPAQPLILTNRFVADGLTRSHARPWPWPEPALKLAEPGRPFPARGPPLWKAA